MKVKFSKDVRFVPEWRDNKNQPDNDQIVVRLIPLDMGELLDTLDILKGAGFSSGEHTTLSIDQMRTVSSQAREHVVKHVKQIEGAENFTLEDIVTYPEFFGLATEIVFELVRISSPSGQDVKN